MSSGRRSSQRKGAASESNRSSSSDLSSQLRDQNQKNFDTLKEGADAVANESEAKLIQMFEELCLRFRTNGSSITDTDVKLLGPRLKSISDAFLKTTQETDMHIKQVEDLFDSKIREMKKNFEEGIRRERKNCEAVVARLEKEVQSERERGEGNLKEVVAQHKEVIEVRYRESCPLS
jgi:hypothetical protein